MINTHTCVAYFSAEMYGNILLYIFYQKMFVVTVSFPDKGS